MKLSKLKTGESAVIVKVSGHGGFRKRVIEMGFIKGKKVDVLLNAPLQDPVKYKIMGYEVSLRHSEADHIEVVSIDEAKNDAKLSKAEEEDRQQVIDSKIVDSNDSDEQALGDKMLVAERKDNASNEALAEQEAERLHRVINVALVGNPNCGKTSLFNFASGAHERVGNYSGVTVDAKVGEADFNGYHFNLVDLPGTYSLSAYSPEELYVRKQLIEHTPDIVINIIDTSNLERNLYLTTQLIDMHIRMVCALNMFDETEKRGDNIDYDKLGELFGISMIPTVFTNGRGVDKLFETIIELYEGKEDSSAHYRHIHINHGHEIEHGIEHIQKYLKADDSIRQRYSTRYLTIRLNELALGAGYGYNLVPSSHLLFHLSALPTITVYSHDYTKMRAEVEEGSSDTEIPTVRNSMKYHFPSAIITGRGAAVYSWRNKFAGATAVYNFSVAGDEDHLQVKRNKWRVRMFFGFRF